MVSVGGLAGLLDLARGFACWQVGHAAVTALFSGMPLDQLPGHGQVLVRPQQVQWDDAGPQWGSPNDIT
jgi:hypothetical protein